MTNPPTRVVLLGAGYVSVFAYRSLVRQLRREIRAGEVELTVVAPIDYHAFHGWTGEVFGGVIAFEHEQSMLHKIMPLAQHVPGYVEHIDTHCHEVEVRGNDQVITTVGYDHLIIGTGSSDNRNQIPGLAEFGKTVKGVGELERLRAHIAGVLETARIASDQAERQRLLSFVVVGGGFTGVELCAALAEMLAVLGERFPILLEQPPQITLVHSGAALLPELRPRFAPLAEYATKQLQHYGVQIRLGTRLAEVTPDGAYFTDGNAIASATVISTIGQIVEPLPGLESMPRASDHRLVADRFLRIGSENIWAGGDVAQVPFIKTGLPCPPNALWAIKHGLWIGDNVAHTIHQRRLRPFTYPGLGQAASLGIGKGAVELYGLMFTGWLGWFLRLGFFLYFLPDRQLVPAVLADYLRHAGSQRYLASPSPIAAPAPILETIDEPLQQRVVASS